MNNNNIEKPVAAIASGEIVVASLEEAHHIWNRFTGVLSIESPIWRYGSQLRIPPDEESEQLVLQFDDLDADCPSGYRMPSAEDVRRILEFGRRHQDGRCLIHCFLGVSRSSAAALAILADRLGPGWERAAVQALVSIRPQAVPNLAVVAIADAILQREGELLRAIVEWDRAQPGHSQYRTRNRMAVLSADPLPLLMPVDLAAADSD